MYSHLFKDPIMELLAQGYTHQFYLPYQLIKYIWSLYIPSAAFVIGIYYYGTLINVLMMYSC